MAKQPPDPLSIALLGAYLTPQYEYGQTVTDAIRGDVIITRTSAAPIPWPMGALDGNLKPGLVIFAGLLEALSTESATAICHHWGITAQTVSKWRGLLGIDQKTPGARRLRQQKLTPHLNAGRSLIDYTTPERSRKIAAKKIGKPRPQHVLDAMREGRGVRAWTPEEDEAVRTLSVSEVVKQTGRTRGAVYRRRARLNAAYD